MEWLAASILLWSAVHLFPALGKGARATLVEKLGWNAYRGAFAALSLVALAGIVFAWRGATPIPRLGAEPELRALTATLMLAALILFASSAFPTDINRLLRHPQLSGVAIWAMAHLVSVRDARALLLFAGLGIWAVAEIIAINRRDGAWIKPEKVGAMRSALPIAVGTIAWIALALAHPWIAGVAIVPYP